MSVPNLDVSGFVEVDPTGRYGRYNEVVGRGTRKIVYRAFDKHQGIEVAWIQFGRYHFNKCGGRSEWLLNDLLKTLNHQNIMKVFTTWVDVANRNINFVTEMFNSSLRPYIQKHGRVSNRTVKNWSRQILEALAYLHSHDPPLIHMNLSCHNIFINGNEGTVKIGGLGLVQILPSEYQASRRYSIISEFSPPEVKKEEGYNELVDVYTFGMCVLEMATCEYPYSECLNDSEIYWKVLSGGTPNALAKVHQEIGEFVKKCLAPVSLRLSATELLNDPFLQIDESELDLSSLDHPIHFIDRKLRSSANQLDEYSKNVEFSIKGERRDDGSIVFRLQFKDGKGDIRKIYFPFDIKIDSIFDVATEMAAEFGCSDQDITKISDISNMIFEEIYKGRLIHSCYR